MTFRLVVRQWRALLYRYALAKTRTPLTTIAEILVPSLVLSLLVVPYVLFGSTIHIISWTS
jgi:hypothetical protein